VLIAVDRSIAEELLQAEATGADSSIVRKGPVDRSGKAPRAVRSLREVPRPRPNAGATRASIRSRSPGSIRKSSDSAT